MRHTRTLMLAGAVGLASVVVEMPVEAMQGPRPGSSKSAQQDFPPFDQISDGFTEVQPPEGSRGMYKLWINQKQQKAIAELPRNFDKQNLFMAWTIAGGVPTAGVQSGDQYAKWKRFGKRLALVEPNYGVVSTGDRQSKDAMRRVHTDRVILEVPILAMGPGGGPVIDLNNLFLGNSRSFFGGRTAGANTRLATIEKAKTFPKNVELAYELPLSGGRFGTLYYSIAEIPNATGYKPREADARAGYFTTSVRDIGDPSADTPWKRYVNRWKLEKADPRLKLSPPKEPIVFYIENTVPVRYRRWVRDGILEWNRAFEEVGIVNAIEVYQQDAVTGAHMEKDPEDARYNFILWTNGNMGFAIGPSRVHPQTGQILDADVVMDEGFVSGWINSWERMVPDQAVESLGTETMQWLASRPQYDPRVLLAEPQDRQNVARELQDRHAQVADDPVRSIHPTLDRPGRLVAAGGADGLAIESHVGSCAACQNAAMKAMDVALMRMTADMLEFQGDESGQTLDGVPEEFIGPLLKEVIMHEVGHTLGLRHNFKGSAILEFGEMNDADFHGQPISTSVMDYLPINIAFGEGMEQGSWTTPTIGPYDVWVIECGYAMGDNKDILARSATDRNLDYATDEDTMGPDPMARRFDHGRNSLDFVESQIGLVQHLRGQIMDRMVDDGESWAKARRGYDMLLSRHINAANIASNWIGGSTVHRVMKGDGSERDPIEPISADQQRRALQIVLDSTMYDEAFGLTPELLRKMTVDKWYDAGGMRGIRQDSTYQPHDRVASVQRSALTWILNPTALRRVYDNEFRAEPGEDVITVPEIMTAVHTTVWSELDNAPAGDVSASNPHISSLRRNLQRAYLERVVDLASENNGFGSVQAPLSSLARQQLRQLDQQIGEALSQHGGAMDAYSKSHLSDAKSHIERVLDSEYVYNPGGGGGPVNIDLGALFGNESE
ncbi:MAG: zinc-dependent metalloprotease [Phycisphaerales bacterium]|nr:zinc-dependent metalloprotease [Phycisphaerales bacterium]